MFLCMMKKTALSLGLAMLLALPLPAAAEDCYADYKARKGSPMSLHYGVIGLSGQACRDSQEAWAKVAHRIGRDGWQLLAIVSVFGPDGLVARRAQAGSYFLRY